MCLTKFKNYYTSDQHTACVLKTYFMCWNIFCCVLMFFHENNIWFFQHLKVMNTHVQYKKTIQKIKEWPTHTFTKSSNIMIWTRLNERISNFSEFKNSLALKSYRIFSLYVTLWMSFCLPKFDSELVCIMNAQLYTYTKLPNWTMHNEYYLFVLYIHITRLS